MTYTIELSAPIANRYELSPDILLHFDFGVNTLGVEVWRWNSDMEDWETLYDKRLSGYCARCGALHALSVAGFDDPYDLIMATNLTTIECDC